jgi:hypothetical protein
MFVKAYVTVLEEKKFQMAPNMNMGKKDVLCAVFS